MCPGIAAQHDDAVGQQHGFLDVMRDQEDGFGGHGLVGPQLKEFGAQVLRREHVERGERLVHEQDLRLDDQGARKAHALPHSARQFLRIGGLEASRPTVSSIFMLRSRRSSGCTPRACSGASTFSRTDSQGNSAKLWKTMETLISALEMGFSCQ